MRYGDVVFSVVKISYVIVDFWIGEVKDIIVEKIDFMVVDEDEEFDKVKCFCVVIEFLCIIL